MLSGTGSNRGTKCIPRLARFNPRLALIGFLGTRAWLEKPEILFFISNDTLYSGEICRVFPLVQRKVTFCILNNIITLLGTIAEKRI